MHFYYFYKRISTFFRTPHRGGSAPCDMKFGHKKKPRSGRNFAITFLDFSNEFSKFSEIFFKISHFRNFRAFFPKFSFQLNQKIMTIFCEKLFYTKRLFYQLNLYYPIGILYMYCEWGVKINNGNAAARELSLSKYCDEV